MEFIGMMLYSIIPDAWASSPYFVAGILISIFLLSEILPLIPEKYVKSNTTTGVILRILGRILKVLFGMMRRLKKDRKIDDEIMNEYESEDSNRSDVVKDPMKGNK